MSGGLTHAPAHGVGGHIKASTSGMKKNKITEIHGCGDRTDVDVRRHERRFDANRFTFDNAIIATGARVTRMFPGPVSQNVVTYEEQILSTRTPGSIVIAGSAIGVGSPTCEELRSTSMIVEFLGAGWFHRGRRRVQRNEAIQEAGRR